MRVNQIGIAPRPLQGPHPPLYGGFAASMRTALFWAKYGGKPIVLTDNLQFYGQALPGLYGGGG
jgi:alkanesulfonate monooxygenase SsuD/methylene tetrahydromethanopterin reductase-like flavin-dependent oxidoreductase (luciferase family)